LGEAERRQLVPFIRSYVAAMDWLFQPANKDEAVSIYVKNLPGAPRPAAEKAYEVMLGPKEGFQRKAKLDVEGARTVLKLRSEIRQASEEPHRPVEVRRRELLQESGAVAPKETQDMSIANSATKATLVVTLAAGLIVGCQTTTDPYTGEKKTTSTTFGALIGAGAGAAIGMISGHDAKQRSSGPSSAPASVRSLAARSETTWTGRKASCGR